MVKFSERLRKKSAPIWGKTANHPFVRGIGDGTLPLKKFRFYLGQDYLFLIEYSRVLALATAKARDLADMGRYAELLNSTLNVEMGLHRGFCQRLGVSPQELEQTLPAPTTIAYTNHLLNTAHLGSIAVIGASLLPCQWGYCEIGQALAKEDAPRGQPLYREWIGMYASPQYAELVDWLKAAVDRWATSAGGEERARMEEVFLTSSRYEYLFWEMAWRMEDWEV